MLLTVEAVVVVVMPGEGAANYMRHVPLHFHLGCPPLLTCIGAVVAGGRLVGVRTCRCHGRCCTPPYYLYEG